jgi:carotenoid cleavage dioxygenase-like enzyme
VLAGLKSYADAMTWEPELGTRVIVCDRATLEVVSQADADPWFQWHIANGFVTPDGKLAIDLCQYADFQTNQRLREIATGEIHTAARSPLTRIWVDPQTAKVTGQQVLVDRDGEFPNVAPDQVGQDAPFTYLSVHRHDVNQTKEIYGAIARYDHRADQLTIADLGQHRYPTEPIYAPHPHQADTGWVLTVVFDGAAHQSEVWIYASDRLDADPLCRLALPSVVPPSFHGTWAGA